MKKPLLLFSIFLALVIFINQSQAQVITSAEIDNLVERTLKTFDVPGIAVAIVKDGKVIHRYAPQTEPKDIAADIQQALKK